MSVSTISSIIGFLIVAAVLFTNKYWIEMPKLSDAIILFLAFTVCYGTCSLIEDLITWWLK